MTSDNPAAPDHSRALVTVRRSVNEHGTMTVEVHDSNEYRQVVAFADDLRSVFATLPEGTTLPVAMEQLHTRGNCWRVTRVGPTRRPGTETTRQPAESTARVTR